MKEKGSINGEAASVFGDASNLERFLKKYANQFQSLTPRETEILRLIAVGEHTNDIAGQLNISIKTVRNYRSRICKKLAIKNMTDYIKYALAFGLISF